MAIYIVLVNFTDQGIRNVKETTKRADATREMAKKFGVNGLRGPAAQGRSGVRRGARAYGTCGFNV